MSERPVDDLDEREQLMLCAVIGRMMLNAPQASVLAGHENMFGALGDYLRTACDVPSDSVEKVVHYASTFLVEIAQMGLRRKRRTVEDLASRWSPPDHELVKDL